MRIDSIYTKNICTGDMKNLGISQPSSKRQELAKSAENAAADLRNMRI